MSDAKLREGIFDEPRIRQLLKGDGFVTKMKIMWKLFQYVTEGFPKRSQNLQSSIASAFFQIQRKFHIFSEQAQEKVRK